MFYIYSKITSVEVKSLGSVTGQEAMQPSDYSDLVCNVSLMNFQKGAEPQKEAEDPMTLATSYLMYKIGEFSKYMIHFNS